MAQVKSQKKTIASSLVISFYQQVQQFKNHYASYSTVIETLETTSDIDELEKLTPEIKQQVINEAQSLKVVSKLVFVNFLGLNRKLGDGIKSETKFRNAYAKFRKQTVPKIEHVEEFIILIDEFIMDHVGDELLLSSAEYVQGMYEE